MKLKDFQIRDPYIVLEDGQYYMFGTAGNDLWGQGWDFSIFRSDDLSEWERIESVVQLPDGFWADQEFWAPEVYKYGGKFYMFMTCMKKGKMRGTQTFVADRITGPFVPVADLPATPHDWMCLDGTLYIDGAGQPYMVFSHEWLQTSDGEIWYAPLSDDLSAFTAPPTLLLKAKESGFCKPIAFCDSWGYPTDGSQIYTCKNGDLLLLWSSIDEKGYFTATARSKNGIAGPFVHEKILYDRDGGHSMIFTDKNGKMKFTFHSPNDIPTERACIVDIEERDNDLFVLDDNG